MSDLEKLVNDFWNDHHKNTEEVANKLKENIGLVEKSEDVPGYVAIVVHTYGGHLGNNGEGIEVLQELEKKFEGDKAIARGIATMAYSADDQTLFEKYSEVAREEGSDVRILSVAASNLGGTGQVDKAVVAFERAMDLAPDNLTSENPAARALAVSGNNIACDLEEKENRTERETELMIMAAKGGRKYWEIAGTWLQVERAEYRLAMTYLQAGNLEQALKHARLCEEGCNANNAEPFEKFYAHEALTKVNRALCEEFKNKVKPEWQEYCKIP